MQAFVKPRQQQVLNDALLPQAIRKIGTGFRLQNGSRKGRDPQFQVTGALSHSAQAVTLRQQQVLSHALLPQAVCSAIVGQFGAP